MSYDIIDGFYTGLTVPETRPMDFPAYRSANRILSRDQIRQIVTHPDRTPARQRFPAAQWIRNQGRRGSCQGYATAWALARVRVLAGLPFVPLSGEFVYAQTNGGRDAGSPLIAGMQKIQEVGTCREDLVKHESYLWRDMNQEARNDASNYRGFECYRVDDESELASGLALGFIGVVCVHASSGYRRLDTRGVRGASRGRGNHAVGVQDVRLGPDGDFEFDEVGSSGRSNGQDGYAWLNWDDHLDAPNEYHANYLIRAATDSKDYNVPQVTQ
jgi:hypothetical protein